MNIDLGTREGEGYLVSGMSPFDFCNIITPLLTSRNFVRAGLQIEGGTISESELSLNDGSATTVEHSLLTWTRKDDPDAATQDMASTVQLPVYTNGERGSLLAVTTVALRKGLGRTKVIQRGCCVKAAD